MSDQLGLLTCWISYPLFQSLLNYASSFNSLVTQEQKLEENFSYVSGIVEWTEPKVTGIPPKPRRLVDSMSMFFNPCLAEAVFVLACKQCNPDQMASDEAITPRSRVFAIHFGIRSEICIR